MLKPYIRDSIYQAFAALAPQGPERSLESYKRWVAKLATQEFADELVVLATAKELDVHITCVPYTKPGLEHWQISRYLPSSGNFLDDRTVFLGNDNVHYMWLKVLEL